MSPPARFPPSLPSGLGPGPGCGRGCVGSLRGDLWVRIPGPSEGAAPMGAACPAGSVGGPDQGEQGGSRWACGPEP